MSGLILDPLSLVCADILDGLGQHAGAATLRWGTDATEPSMVDIADELEEHASEDAHGAALLDKITPKLCKRCKAKLDALAGDPS